MLEPVNHDGVAQLNVAYIMSHLAEHHQAESIEVTASSTVVAATLS